MSNEFLTMDKIAKEALYRLRNQLVMGALVHRDYSGEFAGYGDTVQVKKPATFSANEFTDSISAQDIEEDKALVKLDKIADVSVEVTAKEMTLNIRDFGNQVVEGAMQAIAQKIDSDLTFLYHKTPYYAGGATSTNIPEALVDIAAARAELNDMKAPMSGRRFVVDPATEAKLIVLDSLAGAEKSGSTQTLREASLGRVFGFDTFMSQNVHSHVQGTWYDQTPDLDGTPAAGATTINIKNTGNSKTILRGDMIKIAGQAVDGEDVVFTVLNNVTSHSSAGTAAGVQIYPGLAVQGTNEANVTFVGNHTANIAFHKNAFALVNRPMALPMGGASGAVQSFEGLSIRVTAGYGMSDKKNTISFDCLYGVECIEPKLAVRVWKQ